MADLWATAEQLAFDCDPTWTTNPQPTDDVPTPTAMRLAELSDLSGQGPLRTSLHFAHTVPTGSYL